MSSKTVRTLRVLVIVMLVLLGVQYELGMAANISNPTPIDPFPYSSAAFTQALSGAGLVTELHADFGALLALFSLAVMIFSLLSRVRAVQIFGTLAFLSTLAAGDGGFLFVLSGFHSDNSSHQMATNFLLTFAFYFIELYVLKPGKGE